MYIHDSFMLCPSPQVLHPSSTEARCGASLHGKDLLSRVPDLARPGTGLRRAAGGTATGGSQAACSLDERNIDFLIDENMDENWKEK